MFFFKKQISKQFSNHLFKNAKTLNLPFNNLLRRSNSSFTNIIQGGYPATLTRSQKSLQTLLGAGATFGLLSLIAKGWSASNTLDSQVYDGWTSSNRSQTFSKLERTRLFSTYGHLILGLSTTAAFATLMFRSGFAFRLMSRTKSPLLLFGATIAAVQGTMMGTRFIDYNQNPGAKILTQSGFNASIAFSLCPLGMFGGQLLYRAALATFAIIGSLSSVAAVAPSDKFLNQGGGLSIGLGVLIAASFGQLFFPASSLLYNFVLYGGLGLFSLLTLHDTQLIMKQIRSHNPYFDPINASMSIYLNIINIFHRLVIIMSSGKRR